MSLFSEEPRDIVTIDKSSPEQLSVAVSSLDQMDQTLQKLATKSYLEALQRADLRRDIAARLLPTEDLTHQVTVFTIGKLTKAKFNTALHPDAGLRQESSRRKELSVSSIQVPLR